MINNRKFNLIIIILFLFLSNSNKSLGSENRIIFKINEKAYTSIDLIYRKEYLKFVGNNFELDNNTIVNDFISASLFYEDYINKNNNDKLDNRINEIYNNIENENFKSKKVLNNINKENILFNLKLDFVRKSILEKNLNNKKDSILKEEDDLDLIYKLSIKYINIYKTELKNLKNNFLNINFMSIEDVEEYLKINNVPYFILEKEIDKLDNLNKLIKNNISNDNNFFYLEKDNVLSFIYINKNFETYDGLIGSLYSVKTTNLINEELLTCENIINSNKEYELTNKKYEFAKLNTKIKNNLININDFIMFKNEDNYTYIFLCGIEFDRDKLINFNLNKKINKNVEIIEKKLIKEYSKKYNLINYYE